MILKYRSAHLSPNMSYDGDIPDMNGNPDEAPDIPKHGFGLADDSANVETANVVTEPSPVLAAAAAAAAADGEPVNAPVALAAALAFNQAALDGRPLGGLDSSGGTTPTDNGVASVTGSGMVASPRAQKMVGFRMDDHSIESTCRFFALP